ncbi:subtilisin-like serine endopeptidase family protein [Actinidia rufa]|uniref:Subtilisin-like serine endopeptidase family protein n=1 Tax=Actinidia rufa TaxID=165716 RepID=A0A7J0DBR0_9ERIC|nr:subtilisin-like serine endopeptidase family protein [Actinidia rufa]
MGLSILIACFLLIHHVGSMSVERSTYIVHMDKSVMPKAFASHHHWYTSTVDSLSPVDPSVVDGSRSKASLVYSYDNVARGFSAVLSKGELEVVKKLPGFVSAYRDRQIKLRTTHTPEFLSLNPSAGLWPASNYGKDVIIGVVDTGVLPESRSFLEDGMTSSPIPSKWKGTCQVGEEFNASMCNAKLIGARYFNKGLLASDPNITLTMNSARDTLGHGTHCASTAAGNYVDGASFFGYAEGTARGIAPRARVAVYKVQWPEGFQASDFLAGIDQAVADGVDVLSLSFGFDEDLPFYENPIAIASFGAMEKGVIVFSCRSALVESFIYYNKTLASCDSVALLLDEASFGNIVICEDTGDFFTQLEVVARSRAAAAIFISKDPDLFTSADFPWPGVVISPRDGPAVMNYVKTSARPLATMAFKQTVVGTKPAPALESYSSRGPSRTYTRLLKPDLMAPGSLVLAAWIPNKSAARIGSAIRLSNDYKLLTGTSMACPHVAGVAALLRAAHPKWSPSAIYSAMMTTANALDNTNNPIRDNGRNRTFANPLAMGSGQIDPNLALNPGLVYDLTLQDYPSPDLNYPSFIAFYTNRTTKNTTATFQRTVTNVGDGPATYKVEVVAPAGSVVTVSPKMLFFSNKYEKNSYNLSVEYKSDKNGMVTFGSVIWVEDKGTYRVRSPIVVSPEMAF